AGRVKAARMAWSAQISTRLIGFPPSRTSTLHNLGCAGLGGAACADDAERWPAARKGRTTSANSKEDTGRAIGLPPVSRKDARRPRGDIERDQGLGTMTARKFGQRPPSDLRASRSRRLRP